MLKNSTIFRISARVRSSRVTLARLVRVVSYRLGPDFVELHDEELKTRDTNLSKSERIIFPVIRDTRKKRKKKTPRVESFRGSRKLESRLTVRTSRGVKILSGRSTIYQSVLDAGKAGG